MEILQEITADPLKRWMLIILVALEVPAFVFLVSAWILAKRKEKRDP